LEATNTVQISKLSRMVVMHETRPEACTGRKNLVCDGRGLNEKSKKKKKKFEQFPLTIS
jgi:hypothetical protein